MNATEQKAIVRSLAEVIYGFKINRKQWFHYGKRKKKEDIIDEIVTKQSLRLHGMCSIREFKFMIKSWLNRTEDDSRYEMPFTVIERLREISYGVKDEE